VRERESERDRETEREREGERQVVDRKKGNTKENERECVGERERKSDRAREIGTHTERILFGLCVREREIACAKKRLRERKTERERKKEREYDRKSVIQGHTQKETGFVCWSSDTDRKEYTQKAGQRSKERLGKLNGQSQRDNRRQ